MFSLTSGPHGAEEEREDFWQDIPEGADALTGMPQADSVADFETLSGLLVQEPYSPAMAHFDAVQGLEGGQGQGNGKARNGQAPAAAATNSTDYDEGADGEDDDEDESFDEVEDGEDEDSDGDDTFDEDEDANIASPAETGPYVSSTDPLGSWTGTPTGPLGADEDETPTQDQDDL